MATIIGVSGSVRSGSMNAALLDAAAALAPNGCTVDIASIADIPLYNGDLEANEGIPRSVTQLKDTIANGNGLLLSTPEYNNSVPGVLKNAVDWLSRPPADIPRVFGKRPIGIIGTSPGGMGTRMAQTAWLPVFRALGSQVWFGSALYVGGASKVFDASGKIIDDDVRNRLVKYMKGFAEFIAR
ncbi:MAG: NADPH-dependent FMN reductase [Acidiferrobacterales bacterium]